MPPKQDLVGKTVLTYWQVDAFIGSGGYGNVYKAHRQLGQETAWAAIKHIVIPDPRSQSGNSSSSGDSKREEALCRKLYDDILFEIKAMDALKGRSPNVVTYRNHEVIEHQNPLRYEIFIEMELLTPFSQYSNDVNMRLDEIVKMGMDVASGLEACHSKEMIHRDIKETNIFVDANGTFKLGDFGLAKVLTENSKALSDAGTMAYKAPEVVQPHSDYKKTVDIYSLGIVLYRMFNFGRIPFLPPYPEPYTYDHEDAALARRFKKEQLPPPQNAPLVVSDVILKACAPNAEDRYQTATELRMALQMALSTLNPSEDKKPIQQQTIGKGLTEALGNDKNWKSFGEVKEEEHVRIDIFGSHSHENIDENNYVHIDNKLWEMAVKVGTIESYEEYIYNDTPGKTHVNEAWDKIDTIYWESAKRVNVKESYQNYLNSAIPKKKYEQEALGIIKEIEKPWYKNIWVIVVFSVLIVVIIIATIVGMMIAKKVKLEKQRQQLEQLNSIVEEPVVKTPEPLPEPTPEPVEEPKPETPLPEPTLAVEAVWTNSTKVDTVTVSSTLSSQDSRYIQQNLLDQNISTAWVEGNEGDGVGEWVQFQWQKPIKIKGIILDNGYQKSEDLYLKNNRVKRIELTLSDGSAFAYDLKDSEKQGIQLLLDNPRDVTWVKFTIKEVYKGSKYNDTCISGVQMIQLQE